MADPQTRKNNGGLLPDWLAQQLRDADTGSGAYADDVRPRVNLQPMLDAVGSGITAATDPFHVPSAAIGILYPHTRDEWRRLQSVDPVAGFLGGLAGGSGVFLKGAKAISSAVPGLLPQVGYGAATGAASDVIDAAAGKDGALSSSTVAKAALGGGTALPLRLQAQLLGGGAAAVGGGAALGALFPEHVAAQTTGNTTPAAAPTSLLDSIGQSAQDFVSSFRGKDYTPLSREEFEKRYRESNPRPRMRYATEGEAVEAALAARQSSIDPKAVTSGQKALDKVAAQAREQYRRDRDDIAKQAKAYDESYAGNLDKAYAEHKQGLVDLANAAYDRPFAERNPGIAAAGTVGAGALAALLYGRRAAANNQTLATVQKKIADGPLPTEVDSLLKQEQALGRGTAVLPYVGLGAAGAGVAKASGDIVDMTSAPPDSQAAQLARSKWIPFDRDGTFNPAGPIANAKELSVRGGLAGSLPALLKVPLMPSAEATITAQVRGGKLPDPTDAANAAVTMKKLDAIDRRYLADRVPTALETSLLQGTQARNAQGVSAALEEPLSAGETAAFRKMISDRMGLAPQRDQRLLPPSGGASSQGTRTSSGGASGDGTAIEDVAQGAQTANKRLPRPDEIAASDLMVDPRTRPIPASEMPFQSFSARRTQHEPVTVGDIAPLTTGQPVPATHANLAAQSLDAMITALAQTPYKQGGFEMAMQAAPNRDARVMAAAKVLNEGYQQAGLPQLPTKELAKRLKGSMREFDALAGDKNGRYAQTNRDRVLKAITGKGHTLMVPVTAGAAGMALLRNQGLLPTTDEIYY